MDRARRRGLILLLIAGGLAAITGVLFFNYLEGLRREVGDTTEVVVAAQDITARSLITRDMLATSTIPVRYFHDLYVVDPSELAGQMVALVDISEGEILQRNVVHSNAGLEPNMRAVSMAVNQVTSVGGNVRPGNRVDVIVSFTPPGEDSEPVTMVLLQDVEVLAVSSLLPPVEAGGPARFLPTGEILSDATVTFALTPQDALRLTYMSNFAEEVRLMIRRLDDDLLPALPRVSGITFQ